MQNLKYGETVPTQTWKKLGKLLDFLQNEIPFLEILKCTVKKLLSIEEVIQN